MFDNYVHQTLIIALLVYVQILSALIVYTVFVCADTECADCAGGGGSEGEKTEDVQLCHDYIGVGAGAAQPQVISLITCNLQAMLRRTRIVLV